MEGYRKACIDCRSYKPLFLPHCGFTRPMSFDPKLTPEQKEWLENFVAEWDAAAQLDGAM